MKLAWSHGWDVTPAQARQLQEEARRRVIVRDDAAAFSLPLRLVALDVGYDKTTNLCTAALVVWETGGGRRLPGMASFAGEGHAIITWTHRQPSTFPYVPGLLSFREIPALIPLFERLDFTPELILCDGQGIAHPRRIGLASHIGVLLDCPTLGWAKSRLIGAYAEPPEARGAATPLMIRDEQVGWVLRSRARVRPTFVSPGHRMSLARSLEIARALLGPYRLCEPARLAHRLTVEAAR